MSEKTNEEKAIDAIKELSQALLAQRLQMLRIADVLYDLKKAYELDRE